MFIVRMEGYIIFVLNVMEPVYVSIINEEKIVKIAVEVRFANIINEKHVVKIVAGLIFVITTGSKKVVSYVVLNIANIAILLWAKASINDTQP